MMKTQKKPKTYFIQNGCHNCMYVDRIAVASSIYPICEGYHKKFMVNNFGICKRWSLYEK